jgi:hypothetical protein
VHPYLAGVASSSFRCESFAVSCPRLQNHICNVSVLEAAWARTVHFSPSQLSESFSACECCPGLPRHPPLHCALFECILGLPRFPQFASAWLGLPAARRFHGFPTRHPVGGAMSSVPRARPRNVMRLDAVISGLWEPRPSGFCTDSTVFVLLAPFCARSLLFSSKCSCGVPVLSSLDDFRCFLPDSC